MDKTDFPPHIIQNILDYWISIVHSGVEREDAFWYTASMFRAEIEDVRHVVRTERYTGNLKDIPNRRRFKA